MPQAVRQVEVLERDHELTVLNDALARAHDGHGTVVALEAPAGLGKTTLLDAAQYAAEEQGVQVLTGRGFELERSFTYGVLRQLYEPPLTAGDDDRRDRLLEGSAALAGPAVGLGDAPATESYDPIFAVAHGVYWLTANLATAGPLLIMIDDAQWADTPSLRCAMYLASRVRELPVVLLAAVRPGEPGAPEHMLHSLLVEPETRVLSPRPLSVSATGRLIGSRTGSDVDPSFAAAAHELTGGNPYFAAALAAELRDQGVRPNEESAPTLPSLTSDAVGRAVLVRLLRLGEPAVLLAQSVAVLGDGASLPNAAKLAQLDVGDAVVAADRLAGADILRSAERLGFTHPLVRAAVHDETPHNLRAVLHRRAAQVLHAAGASAEQAGSQLLHAQRAGDDWVHDRLVEAGEAAQMRGDMDSALAFLRRALDEPPSTANRARLLYVLGKAEVRAGAAEGTAHLDEAADLATDPSLKAVIEFHRARAMLLAGRPEAVDALTRATAELPEGERGDGVRRQVELIALGRISPATAPLVTKLVEALKPVAEQGGPGWEAAMGVVAGQAFLDNRPAAYVADLASRSLDARRRRGEEPAESLAFINACYALLMCGRFAEAEAHLEYAIASARRANALIGFAAASSFRAVSALRRGDLAQAEADASMALEAAEVSLTPLALPATVGFLIEVLVERGDLDAAERMLVERKLTGDLSGGWTFNELIFARGRLRRAQENAEAAVADLFAAGDSAQGLGVRGPGPFPWRAEVAEVLVGLGRRHEAQTLVDEGLDLARVFGAPRDLGIALRAAGNIAHGDSGLTFLEESVAVLAPSPVKLELARSRTDLGAALRRAGHREAARAALRDALDHASTCGATALAERAHAELVAAGAKPRRERISGLPALTASERRVAELAVDGLTNRELAEALFVTTSTVEKHLASVYSKLGIGGRTELPEAFAAGGLSG